MKIADRLAGFLEEQVIVVNLARAYEGVAESELPMKDFLRSRTKQDETVLSGLG